MLKRPLLRYPLASLTGVLMVLAFPRCGLDFLVWVSLVPLLFAAVGAGARAGFLSGWFAGLAMVFGGFNWVLFAMREFTGLGPFAVLVYLPWLLYESLPWGLVGLALGLLRSRGDAPAPAGAYAAIPLWVGIESFFPRLFPWEVGGALFDRSWLIQSADIFGAGGLTALVFLVNVVLYLSLLRLRSRGGVPWIGLAAALALLAGANLYGWRRLDQVERAIQASPELEVGIVQPVAAPEERQAGDFTCFQKLETLTRALAQKGPLDLAVWPEGADPVGIIFQGGKAGRPQDRRLATGFENLPAPLVAGTWSYDRDTRLSRNTAEYVLPGKWPSGFYHKRSLLLFGEYVPLWDLLPEGVRARLPNIGSIAAGDEDPIFELPARSGTSYRAPRFRILICYEGILAGRVRAVSSGADFLVNVTEDIWYGNTSHIPQHLSLLRLRAVENRIAIARAANVGPSGVIDPAGRMAGPTLPYQKTERVFSLHPARLASFYGKVGFVFPWICLPLGLLVFSRFVALRLQSKTGAD
jgi:apolipoprotein N-acyltransferase